MTSHSKSGAKKINHKEPSTEDSFIEHMEFSARTYSFRFRSPFEPPVHLLLEFDVGGRLCESICECPEENCRHQKIALESITKDGLRLHQRFKRHFWHKILFALSCLWDKGSEFFEAQKKRISIEGEAFSLLIESKSADLGLQLKKIVQERPDYNERNSIKFSNQSEKELKAYRKGRPLPWLKYELSVWSDIAKTLFNHYESVKENLEFEAYPLYEGQVRWQAKLKSKSYTIEFKLDNLSFELFLEFLPVLEKNLVHSLRFEDYIKEILLTDQGYKLIYDKKAPKDKKRASTHDKEPLWTYKNWSYYRSSGLWLYGKESAPWPEEMTEEMFVTWLDSEDPETFVRSGLKINWQPINLNYHVDFDEEGAIIVEPYLITRGDIAKGAIKLVGDWAFESGKNLQKIAKNPFQNSWSQLTRIPPSEVESFVDENLEFLRTKAEFEVHTMGLDLELEFQVNPLVSVSFADKLKSDFSLIRVYGRWIFMPSEGLFWQKNKIGIAPGQVVPWSNLERFIDNSFEALEQIPHFFAASSPLDGQFIRLEIEDKKIRLIPYFVYKMAFQKYLNESSSKGKGLSENLSKGIYWAGKYSYTHLPGKPKGFLDTGFFKHDSNQLLPQEYRHIRVVDEEDFDDFFQQEWPQVIRHVEKIPREFQSFQNFVLRIHKIHGGVKGAKSQAAQKRELRLEMKLVTEEGQIDLSELLKIDTLLADKRYHPTSLGLYDKHSPLGKCLRSMSLLKDSSIISIDFISLLRLRDYIKLDASGTVLDDFLSSSSLETTPKKVSYRELLKAKLRPYQEVGVNWMSQLREYGLGALLCDDMGLGKTHQVMGVMAEIYVQDPKARTLIVCPTSVIYHWLDKLANFLPSLTVSLYHGANRSLDASSNVIITSYGLLRTDTALRKSFWDLVIFDEVQLAKNQKSRIWKAAKSLRSLQKIGLSGTPIENSLLDLKALFDLIYPGYFPEDGEFKAHYLQPIEKEGCAESLEKLKENIAPLILRRSKAQVLFELPEKIEQMGSAAMSDEQLALYNELLSTSREALISKLEDASEPIPYMHIFALMNALKQICNHPACYWRNRSQPASLGEHQSGKFDLFTTLLHEAIDSGHKVVVFSQYLAMLDLIEEYLSSHNIGFTGIRGSTKARHEAIMRFQSEDSTKVFVASLTAGGLGIELTAGSVVILYDRWWNSARENQAIDRVHRMGQSRGVQIFRLLTRSSIEERIATIIERKAKLLEEVAPCDDPSVFKSFTREELLELLKAP